MATNRSRSRSSSSSDTPDVPVPSEADLGLDVGYLGTKVDPRPNEEYSLESGPDSPSAAPTPSRPRATSGRPAAGAPPRRRPRPPPRASSHA
jgi:hypothetical protein